MWAELAGTYISTSVSPLFTHTQPADCSRQQAGVVSTLRRHSMPGFSGELQQWGWARRGARSKARRTRLKKPQVPRVPATLQSTGLESMKSGKSCKAALRTYTQLVACSFLRERSYNDCEYTILCRATKVVMHVHLRKRALITGRKLSLDKDMSYCLHSPHTAFCNLLELVLTSHCRPHLVVKEEMMR